MHLRRAHAVHQPTAALPLRTPGLCAPRLCRAAHLPPLLRLLPAEAERDALQMAHHEEMGVARLNAAQAPWQRLAMC